MFRNETQVLGHNLKQEALSARAESTKKELISARETTHKHGPESSMVILTQHASKRNVFTFFKKGCPRRHIIIPSITVGGSGLCWCVCVTSFER